MPEVDGDVLVSILGSNATRSDEVRSPPSLPPSFSHLSFNVSHTRGCDEGRGGEGRINLWARQKKLTATEIPSRIEDECACSRLCD